MRAPTSKARQAPSFVGDGRVGGWPQWPLQSSLEGGLLLPFVKLSHLSCTRSPRGKQALTRPSLREGTASSPKARLRLRLRLRGALVPMEVSRLLRSNHPLHPPHRHRRDALPTHGCGAWPWDWLWPRGGRNTRAAPRFWVLGDTMQQRQETSPLAVPLSA